MVGPKGSRRAHVYLEGGVIVAVDGQDRKAERTIDATGLLVLPGMVDAHVRFDDPGEGASSDFPAETRAAAARGVTTVVEYSSRRPVGTAVGLVSKAAYLDGRSNVDFGLAAHLLPDHVDEVEGLWRGGATYFKLSMAANDAEPEFDAASLHQALTALAAAGAPALIHCEEPSLVAAAEERLRSEVRSEPRLLLEWHAREAELAAIALAGVLVRATGATATVAHASSLEALSLVEQAHRAGADLTAEMCHHYFALREDDVLLEGSLRKVIPPVHTRNNADEDAMWELLRAGGIGHLASDHAALSRRAKAGSMWDAPTGMPGLDTALPYLLESVRRGRLQLEDVVRHYAEAPARRWGLYPRKGTLEPGADADVVIVDPAGSWTVTDATVLSGAGWSPLSGRTLRGRIVHTLLRGEDAAVDGVPADARRGRFLPGPGAA